MPLLERLSGRSSRRHGQAPLRVEVLEDRSLLAVTGVLSAGALVVNGDANAYNRIFLDLDIARNQIVLSDGGQVLGRFDSAAVASITVNGNGRNNLIRVDAAILQPATLTGGTGADILIGGGGATKFVGGLGVNRIMGGTANDVVDATMGDNTIQPGNGVNVSILGPRGTQVNASPLEGLTPDPGNPLVNRQGRDKVIGFKDRDAVVGADATLDRDFRGVVTPPDLTNTLGLTPSPAITITADEVGKLLNRAAAATASDDGIVAIVDRNGRILGVRVEAGVDPSIVNDPNKLAFAIDGALAEARTGAFFGNNAAPLTSRTIQFISQTTVTQREIESNPSITDPNSTLKGPGTVAPLNIGGHFPPGVQFTPQVDLFGIENTNRDTTFHPIYDANGNIIGRTMLPERFNANPAFVAPGQELFPPDSYGFVSGTAINAQPRGIGTLPGGIPIVKQGVVVGGIGVFFPGKTGFADEENSALNSNFNPNKRDRALEAEYVAFAALGGSVTDEIDGTTFQGFQIGNLAGLPPLPGFALASGRIDLVGITLPLFGPDGINGPENLVKFGRTLGIGNPNSGNNVKVDVAGTTLLNGVPVPEGWLVTPHDGTSLTAEDVRRMITQGVQQAIQTRAAIRLPQDTTAVMVFAVSDQKTGEVLGLFRMPDSTIFSIDVAVAKSRNVAYYADPNQLQAVDQVGVQAGVAFTNRTFRYLALPRFPEGIDGRPPGPFSILNVPGTDPTTGLNTGAPQPASAFFNNVFGHDTFFPQTNFHQQGNVLNQDGIVFFPGSVPLYKNGNLVGGVGISGDGVDQDDVVTFATKQGFETPDNVLRADQTFVRGIRLPYQKFNRQPLEEPNGNAFQQ